MGETREERVRAVLRRARRLLGRALTSDIPDRRLIASCVNHIDALLSEPSEPEADAELYVCESGGDGAECVIVRGMAAVRSWVHASMFSGRWDEAPDDVKAVRDSVSEPADWEGDAWEERFEDGWLRVRRLDRIDPCALRQRVPEASARAILRHYWNAEETHCPYQYVLHDEADARCSDRKLIQGLIEEAGAEDGDVIELVVRRTGDRPYPGRIWKRGAPHTYEPVDRAIAQEESDE